MSGKIQHGYWGIRGLGQVNRLLLAYTGADWVDVPYTSPEAWGKDKEELKFDFPNLPYIIDGDFKLTESSAIYRYIVEVSKKPELMGKDLQDRANVNELIGVFGDVRAAMGPLFFDKDYEQNLPAALEKVKAKLDNFAKFVGDKTFCIGYLTVVDFIISEASYAIEKLFPAEYKKWAFFQKIRESVEALPEIQSYYKLETAMKGPFLPPSAAVQF